jgi:hypothetical protein
MFSAITNVGSRINELLPTSSVNCIDFIDVKHARNKKVKEHCIFIKKPFLSKKLIVIFLTKKH